MFQFPMKIKQNNDILCLARGDFSIEYKLSNYVFKIYSASHVALCASDCNVSFAP